MRQPQSASGGIPSGLGMPFGSGIPSMSRGACDFPGCDRPKYVENDGRVHDFCGRTCARKFAELQKKHSQKQKPATAAGSVRLKSFLVHVCTCLSLIPRHPHPSSEGFLSLDYIPDETGVCIKVPDVLSFGRAWTSGHETMCVCAATCLSEGWVYNYPARTCAKQG